MFLLIDNYDSFTYILYQYLNQIIPTTVMRHDEDLPLDLQKKYKAVVLSPGPGLPKTSGKLMSHLDSVYQKMPVLGICLGHQAIGEIFGAKLEQTPEVFHGRPSEILHNGEGVFKNIPNGFLANRYHSWAVSKVSLPSELEVTAETKDGVIMGIRHRKWKKVFGVQFHPESILTENGETLLRNFYEEVIQ
ncbi:aminodeoxychorismate/anthranilate synthase component II [Leptospira sp. 2 VSF19]|uniref:Aminodeoxychorismate/anthranilate synthase component II n=1 Tax=Leptospira soteropolitanensis TaxID=2950025 RepID=A0AAW5V9Q7_9LEPT|nr:aminodeoxychorismate/anthranilate synthase component II [Leptospira soteropolitanensis]MCW7491605.1 aminodeoxychorismate/anthranilate synthase component II [Leptospira soteropolitanensis]MCW7499189.1 aminodeoxychorismate/anthranilate synthase component II [Leptospira soteropolitanensis]MCW7521219.1 aminodeoxychorismate/anthranilate synthase component II [Leptospira soteropolitanensis]MCW7525293.1 aminodeoxychorismate/anthranilate synthase component II [Leptospira soteropolitanensis]MCW75291